MLAHPPMRESPLFRRNDLYEERTEVMSLHYTAREGETVQDVEGMRPYPYICKYFKFSLCHPVIQVGEFCKERETFLRKDGLIKFSIISPERFIIPCYTYVLIRNSRSVCRTCALNRIQGIAVIRQWNRGL